MEQGEFLSLPPCFRCFRFSTEAGNRTGGRTDFRRDEKSAATDYRLLAGRSPGVTDPPLRTIRRPAARSSEPHVAGPPGTGRGTDRTAERGGGLRLGGSPRSWVSTNVSPRGVARRVQAVHQVEQGQALLQPGRPGRLRTPDRGLPVCGIGGLGPGGGVPVAVDDGTAGDGHQPGADARAAGESGQAVQRRGRRIPPGCPASRGGGIPPGSAPGTNASRARSSAPCGSPLRAPRGRGPVCRTDPCQEPCGSGPACRTDPRHEPRGRGPACRTDPCREPCGTAWHATPIPPTSRAGSGHAGTSAVGRRTVGVRTCTRADPGARRRGAASSARGRRGSGDPAARREGRPPTCGPASPSPRRRPRRPRWREPERHAPHPLPREPLRCPGRSRSAPRSS